MADHLGALHAGDPARVAAAARGWERASEGLIALRDELTGAAHRGSAAWQGAGSAAFAERCLGLARLADRLAAHGAALSRGLDSAAAALTSAQAAATDPATARTAVLRLSGVYRDVVTGLSTLDLPDAPAAGSSVAARTPGPRRPVLHGLELAALAVSARNGRPPHPPAVTTADGETTRPPHTGRAGAGPFMGGAAGAAGAIGAIGAVRRFAGATPRVPVASPPPKTSGRSPKAAPAVLGVPVSSPPGRSLPARAAAGRGFRASVPAITGVPAVRDADRRTWAALVPPRPGLSRACAVASGMPGALETATDSQSRHPVIPGFPAIPENPEVPGMRKIPGDPGAGDPGAGDPVPGVPVSGDSGSGASGSGVPAPGDPGSRAPVPGDAESGFPGAGGPGSGAPGPGVPASGVPGPGVPGVHTSGVPDRTADTPTEATHRETASRPYAWPSAPHAPAPPVSGAIGRPSERHRARARYSSRRSTEWWE